MAGSAKKSDNDVTKKAVIKNVKIRAPDQNGDGMEWKKIN